MNKRVSKSQIDHYALKNSLEIMESENSASWETQTQVETSSSENNSLSNQWFTQKFDEFLPKIQAEWPDLAKHTIEATRGSLDDLVEIISMHSGKTSEGVVEQLEEILNAASDRTKEIAESLEPLKAIRRSFR